MLTKGIRLTLHTSTILGIAVSTIVILLYDHVNLSRKLPHDWIYVSTFLLFIFLLGILQMISSTLFLYTTATKQEIDNLFLTGWTIINLLTILGLFGSYSAINIYRLDDVFTGNPILFHIVILTDTVFLIVNLVYVLWIYPGLIGSKTKVKVSSSLEEQPNIPSWMSTNRIYITSGTSEPSVYVVPV